TGPFGITTGPDSRLWLTERDANRIARLELGAFNPPLAPPAPSLTPNQQFVAQAYRDVLGREPEPAGLAYYSSYLDQGGSRLQVVGSLVNGEEHHAKVVQELYQSLLGRPADPFGLAWSVNYLAQKESSVFRLKLILMSSTEYSEKRGGGTNAGFVAA